MTWDTAEIKTQKKQGYNLHFTVSKFLPLITKYPPEETLHILQHLNKLRCYVGFRVKKIYKHKTEKPIPSWSNCVLLQASD